MRAASQVKALLCDPSIDRAPDPAGHVGFHLFGYVPEPHTLYKSIRAVPAGCSLWIGRDGTKRMQRFFDPAQSLREPSNVPTMENLAGVLRDSVAAHRIADVPVGLFLSAGLDSATLCGLAAEKNGADLRTLTLAFDEFQGTANDEAPLAEEIARAYATQHTTVHIAGSGFASERDKLLAAMDQPTIDGVNVYFVAKAAADAGLKVALSGLGGDEMFAGYDTFTQVPKLVRGLGRVPGGRMLGQALRAVSAPIVKHFTSPKYAGLLELGTRTSDAYLLRRGLFMPWELPDVMDPDMAREGWRELSPQLRLAETTDKIDGSKRAVHALELSWYMRNQLLRDADWAGMAHSLEIRVPLVDRDVFAALSPFMGRAGAAGKQDMALTPSPALPTAVLNRAKTGFFIPVRDWLQGEDDSKAQRGLRGWAQAVYAGQAGL